MSSRLTEDHFLSSQASLSSSVTLRVNESQAADPRRAHRRRFAGVFCYDPAGDPNLPA